MKSCIFCGSNTYIDEYKVDTTETFDHVTRKCSECGGAWREETQNQFVSSGTPF